MFSDNVYLLEFKHFDEPSLKWRKFVYNYIEDVHEDKFRVERTLLRFHHPKQNIFIIKDLTYGLVNKKHK